jgi:hypothetical protein
VQYRFLMIPKYQDGKGIIIFKKHHVFTDGMGAAFLCMAMNDKYDAEGLPGLKPLPFAKKCFIYLISPYLVIRSGLRILFQYKDRNCIKNRPNSGKKVAAFTLDINLQAMKSLAKANGATVNDFITSLLSVTLYRYFADHSRDCDSFGNGYEIPKEINMGLAYSMRRPQKNLEDLRINNDVAPLCLYI